MKLLLPLLALLVSVDAAPKLLVDKALLSKYPAAGQENVYEYQIVNKGDSAALNVTLDDRKSFPTDRFDIRRGSTIVKFSVIPAHSSVQHHIVVVPLGPQELIHKEVVVDFIDEKTGVMIRSTGYAFTNNGHGYYYSAKAIAKKIGGNMRHFIAFAGLVIPLTAVSGLFYWYSAKRYPVSPVNYRRRRS